jgi:hypothetical protein
MAEQLTAATARTDITPPVGISHANWGAQTHERAAGVDLPLWATALALSDGDETVVIVDFDLLFLYEDDAREIRQAVADRVDLPTSNVRLSCTHTHSGPTMRRDAWVEGGSEMVGPYIDSLQHEAAGVAWEAVESLEPARVRYGSGSSEIAVNRRFRRPEDGKVIVGHNPEGPVDDEVLLLRVDTADGDPLAAVVNYACHPITVGPDCDQITPDYPGVVKRTVEDATGATCIFLQGATGDVGPIYGCARNGAEEYKPLGRRLGHEAVRVWTAVGQDRDEEYASTLESGAPLAVYDYDSPEFVEGSITVGSYDLDLPLKDLPTPEELESQYEDERAHLQELREQGAAAEEIQHQTFRAKRLKLRADIARRMEGQTHETYELQVFGIGDAVALASIPGEPFVEIGTGVKEGSPYDCTMFSGYSNVGYHAYVPTADQYPAEQEATDPADYGQAGYEVGITPFSSDAAGRIVEETVSSLDSQHSG